MKYTASVCVVAWLAMVAVALLWLGTQSGQRPLRPYPAETAVAGGQTELVNLQTALVELRNVGLALNAPVSQEPLIALAPQLQPEIIPAALLTPVLASNGQRVQAVAPVRRVVSLVYVSGGFRRAVIDGVYVQTGSKLPGNNARVVEIQADAVVIAEAGVRRVLKVDARANVLGRATPAGS